MKRALLLLFATGCNEYHAESFTFIREPWPGTSVELPCLDVAVWARHDRAVGEPVVQYSFGNRCEHDATLDLGAASVIARTFDGREHTLYAVDPRNELHPVVVPARISGSERLAYAPVPAATVAQLCIDVGAIERSGDATPRWVCSALDGAR